MITNKLNRKSWHYLYAQRGNVESKTQDNWIDYDNNIKTVTIDRCAYRGCVLAGLFITLLCYSLVGLAVSAYIDLAMAIWFWQDPSPLGIIALALTGMMILGVCCYLWFEAKDRWQKKFPYKKNEPGYLSLAYRGWKEKTCTMLEF